MEKKAFWGRVFLVALLAASMASGVCFAQFFDDEAPVSRNAVSGKQNTGISSFRRQAVPSTASRRTTSGTNASSNPNLRRNYLTGEKMPSRQETTEKMPENITRQASSPTKDGSQRGRAFMGQVVRSRNGNLALADTSSIFLFYDGFRIRRGLSNTVSCDVRFVVLTTLDSKMNMLSVKLKWPNLETSLNFANVPPNRETYFDYTLYGDGCYSLDKIPNVIVNRCRVAGMSSAECAGKIKWLRKGM